MRGEPQPRRRRRRIDDPITETASGCVREPEGTHPPLDFAEHASTRLRHPVQPRVHLPTNIAELSGPALGSVS